MLYVYGFLDYRIYEKENLYMSKTVYDEVGGSSVRNGVELDGAVSSLTVE